MSARIRQQVGGERVLAAVSGGVDSSVAAALVHKAIGDQLVAVFVDTGLLRKGEPEQVAATFRQQLGVELIAVDAADEYLRRAWRASPSRSRNARSSARNSSAFLSSRPKRSACRVLGAGHHLPRRGRIAAPDRNKADKIKTHHNVGGLPKICSFQLVEPLRYLFKDEVRAVGEALGLPEEMVWRQPFPVRGWPCAAWAR